MRKLLWLLCVFCFVEAPLHAEDAEVLLDKRVAAISTEVLSPFCPGRALSDCPSNAASDLKKEIRTRLANGQSEEDVYDYLYTLYGGEIRAAPEFASFGIVAWLAPAFFLLAGFLIIVLWLRYSQRAGDEISEEEHLF